MDQCAILEFANAGKEPELDVDAASGAKTGQRSEGHAALHGVMIDSSKIERGALTRFGAINAIAASLHAANAQLFAAGKEFDFGSGGDLAPNQRSSDHGPETLYRERTINRQAKIAAGIFSRDLAGLLDQRLFQLDEAGAS